MRNASGGVWPAALLSLAIPAGLPLEAEAQNPPIEVNYAAPPGTRAGIGYVTEGDKLEFTVARRGDDTSQALTVSVGLEGKADTTLYTYNSTDDDDFDFSKTTTSLTFEAGSSASQTITVQTKRDTIYEPQEGFNVIVSGSYNGDDFEVEGPLGRLIEHDTPQVEISHPEPFRITEGDNGTVTFTLKVDGNEQPVPHRVYVEYEVMSRHRTSTETVGDGGATMADHEVTRGRLTIPPRTASVTFDVRTLEDTVPEPDEQFVIRFYGVTQENPQDTANYNHIDRFTTGKFEVQVVVTIMDDDTPQSGQRYVYLHGTKSGDPLGRTRVSLNEGSSAQVTVTLVGEAPTSDVSIPLTFTGFPAGEVTSGDYRIPASVTIGSGQRSGSVTLQVAADSSDERHRELLAIEIDDTAGSWPTGYTKGDRSRFEVVMLDNNKTAASLRNLSRGALTEAAGAQTATFELHIARRPKGNVSGTPPFAGVSLAEGGALLVPGYTGTAKHGPDYSSATEIAIPEGSGTLPNNCSASGGAVTCTVTLTVVDDNLYEGGSGTIETVNIDLDAGRSRFNDGIARAAGYMGLSLTIEDNDLQPMFSIANASGPEAGNLTFTVTRSGAPGNDVSVTTATGDHSGATHPATASADYTAKTESLRFRANDTQETFQVAVTDDNIDEPDETFAVTLSNPVDNDRLPAPGIAAGAAEATGTITDDDAAPGAITLTVDADTADTGTQTSVAENGGARTARVTATITSATRFDTAEDLTVTVGKPTDTATGADYAAVADLTLTLAAGAGSGFVDFTLAPTDDDIDEDDESIAIDGALAGVTVAPAAVTITDDDMATLAIANATAAEGATATFTVSLSTESARDVAVTATTSTSATDTATANADYTAKSQELTIDAGGASADFEVAILNDSLNEIDETFTVTLTAASGATIATATAAGTITGNAATLITPADATAREGGNLRFTLTRTGDTAGASSLTFTTGADTTADARRATATDDYTPVDTATAVTFAADETVKTLTVATAADNLVEGPETLRVNLAGVNGATLARTHAIGTIAEGTTGYAIADANAGEGDNLAFTVTRSGDTAAPSTVTWTTADDTADDAHRATASGDGADYTPASTAQTLSFLAGETAKTLTVASTEDSLDEPDETFLVTLAGPRPADGVLLTATATGTIEDDDAATATVSVANAAAVAEGDDPTAATDMTFTVSLSQVSGQTVTVPFALGGTAAEDDDYTAPSPLRVAIAPGERSADIAVPIKGDVLDEDNETVTVTLGQPANAALSAAEGAAEATGIITDDDAAPGAITLTVDADTADTGTQTSVAENGGARTARVTATITSATRFDTAEDLTVAVGKPTDTATGTGAGADYAAVADLTLTLAAGAGSGFVDFTLTPTDDDIDEDDESLSIEGELAGVTFAQTAVTITDDDTATLSIANASAAEGATATFTVSLSTESARDVAVTATTSTSATDTANADYTAKSQELTIDAGGASADFEVAILNDSLNEIDETFTVTLSAASGATIATATAAGTITGNAATLITPADATAREGGNLRFTLTRTGDTAGISSLTFTTGADTTADARRATATDDYTPVDTATAVTFADAETVKTITVATAADNLVEGAETLRVNLAGVNGATLARTHAIGTIAEGTTGYAIADANAGEGANLAFTVTRSGDTAAPSTVTWTTADDTADDAHRATASGDGADYTPASTAQTLSFLAGETAKTLTVASTEDSLDEPDETFLVTLAGPRPADGVLLTATATGTIEDDDAATATVSVANAAAVAEGDDPTAATDMTFTVSLSQVSGQTVTVPFALGGTAAEDDDYTAPSPLRVAIAPGERSADIAVPIKGDVLDEDNETVTVTLGQPANAALSAAEGAAEATGTITDDDTRGITVSAAADGVSVLEADDASTMDDREDQATYTVALDSEPTGTVTVDIESGDTAVATAGPARLTFTPDDWNEARTVTVTAVDDDADNADDRRTATIAHTVGASATDYESVTADGVTVTVTDDDGAPTLAIDSPSVAEGDNTTATLTFTVSLSPASGKTVTVGYADRLSGTATSGTDYTALTAGTLTFDPGETAKTIGVTVAGDTTDEPDETVALRLSSATNATLAGGAATLDATGTIEDNDTATLSIANATAAEGATATFTVSLSTESARDVAVTATTSTSATDTANANADYTAKSQELTIDAGGASADFEVAILNDSLNEIDETFTVTLSAASGATIATATAAGTITGNAATLITPADATAREGGNLRFTLTRTGDTAGASSLTFTTGADTTADARRATATDDYTAVDTATTVTFAADETVKTLTVATAADNLVEGPETLRVNLAGVSGATLARTHAIGTIAEGTTGYAIADANAGEGDNLAFTVTRSGDTAAPSTVTWTTADDTADDAHRATASGDGADYTPASTAQTLSFLAGETAKTLTVASTEDSLDEPDETFLVTLAGPRPADGVLLTATATGTIEDDDAATATVSVANAAAVAEGDDPTAATDMTFTVSLSQVSGQTVTVPFALGGTAAEDDDYTAPSPLRVAIAPGERSADIAVPIKGDVLDEDNETVTVTLGQPANASLSAAEGAAEATGTITDDDAAPGAITLTVDADTADTGTQTSVAENGGAKTARVTATITSATRFDTAEDLTVTVGKPTDTATGADYAAVADLTLTLAAGAGSGFVDFTLAPTDDDIDEDDESIAIDGALAGVTVAPAAVTITDDDMATLAIANATAAEGATATFTVSLSTESARDVAVTATTSTSATDTATANADYTAKSQELTIDAGGASADFEVAILNDSLNEIDETFTVTLTAASGAAIATDTATGTITDDDDAPSAITLTVDADTADTGTQTSVTENGGAKTARVTATIASATRFDTDEDITVTVGKSTDTATGTGNADYAAVADLTLTITAGAASGFVDFTLTPTDDDIDEDDESIAIDGTLAGVTVTPAAVTIEDNDTATLAIDDAEAAEGGTATFTVTLSTPSARDVTVTATTSTESDDTATANADYTPKSQQLAIAAGGTRADFEVATLADNLHEIDETFTVTLSAASGATIATATATGTIEDDDAATSVVSVADAETVTEGDDSKQVTDMTFAVSIAPVSGRDVTIPFTLSGTATGGVDYTFPDPLSVTIPKGQGSGVITVPIIGDVIDEKNETVIVTLDQPDHADIPSTRNTGFSAQNAGFSTRNTDIPAARHTAIGIIADNDPTPITPITIAVADAEGPEGTYIEFPVTLSRPSPGNVEVKWSSMAEIASFHSDIAFVEGRLHFAEGEREKIIKVWANEDDVYDPNEVFTVRLQQPVGAVFKNPVTFIPEMHRHEKLIPAGREIALATGTIIDPVPAPAPLELSIGVQETPVDEGGWAQVEVTASAPNGFNRRIRVPLVYSNGTAEDGDYEAQTGLWLEPGRTSAARFIAIFHDDDTDDETLTISLGEPRPREARTGSPSSVDLTIRDDGGAGNYPDVELAIAVDADTGTDGVQDSVAEDGGARTARVTATLEGATRFAEEKRVAVTVGGAADGATEGTDYAQVADLAIIIAAGAASGHADFTLTPTDDALAEMDETITIEGALPNIPAAHATIRIADDDGAKMALTLAVDTDTGRDGLQSEIAEGDGETLVRVTARMTGSDRFQTGRTLMVRVGVTGDSAAEGIDYAALDDFPITVEAGDAGGTGTFRITPVDDKMAEGAETVTVEGRLTGASVGSTWLTIADNDEAPSGIALSVSPAGVGEDDGQTAVTVTATVPGGATYPEDTEVTVTVGSGTATAGADFSPVEDFSITIAGGASSGSGNFALSPVDDDDSEGDETVAVTGAAGDIEVTATAVTIQDDEAPARQLVLSAADVAVDEGASASWTVRLSAVPDGPVAVTISGHEGTGLSLDSARLEFDETNWNSARTVTVTAGEDDDAADDTATLAHAASGGGYDSATASLRVVTDDNDTAAIVLAPDSLDLAEGRSGSYTVTLATEPSDDVGVAITGFASTQLRLDRSDLMFTPSDWNIPQSVTVTAQDDGTDGGARREIITLTHTGSGGGYDGTVARLGIDVLLDPITISIEDAEGPEGGYLEFPVTLSHPSPGDVEVNWATHPEVAKSGYDFPLISGRLHFAAGEREKVISVWAEEDDLDDPNETFTVDLWRPSGAVLDNPVTVVPRFHHFDLTTETTVEIIQATGTIIGPAPDPLVLSISASESFVEEGGTTRVRVTATAPNELERAIRVPLVYSNGTAEDGDYEGGPGLWIDTGRTRGSADITVFHDEDTDDETFTVSIGELRPLEAVAGDDDSFDLTILDDDRAGDFEGLTVSVEDATANEGEENLRFVVRLSGPAPGPVTVWAETRAGTASVNKDYNHASGEVRFEPGERMRTFTVWVRDDDIDEGHETLTLELSDPDPAGVMIARATATGTIKNSDPIPGAWLARFGRALAQQTVDSVSDRFQARREPGFEGSAPMIGLDAGDRDDRAASPDVPEGDGPGRAGGSGPVAGPGASGGPGAMAGSGPAVGPGPGGGIGMTDARAEGAAAPPRHGTGPSTAHGTPGGHPFGSARTCGVNGLASGPGSLPARAPGAGPAGMDPPLAGSGSGPARDGGAGRCGEGPSIGGFFLQALSGASFTRTGKSDPGGGTLAWWGRGSTSRFSGSDGGLGLGGGIATGRLGVDYGRAGWLAGLALAHSAGRGDWSGGAAGGELEASLTSVSPYAAVSVSDRLQAWSTAGAGWGTLKLAHGNGDEWTEHLKTDLEWRMAAAGAKGALLGSAGGAGPALSAVADALWSGASSGTAGGLAASRSAVTRLRVGLEGAWTARLGDSGSLTPKLELGARHDGGDAETGFGADLGGGISWSAPKRGISLDVAGRTLVAHEDEGARDWGVSAAFAYRANPDSEKGLALELGRELGGQSAGGLAALFAPGPRGRRFGADGAGRWTSELSYGFPAFGGRFMATPRVNYGLSGTAREYSLGWGIAPTRHGPDLSIDILSTWRDNGREAPAPGARIEIKARW